MDEYAVIVAGGSGSRMSSNLPKQFIEIGRLPILMRTINQFIKYSTSINILLVLPENQIEFWLQLCIKHSFYPDRLSIVKGGNTRFQSCRNGINSILVPNALVAIHDGVRPFISTEIIKKGFELSAQKATAVCCVVSKDSTRYLDVERETNTALDRNRVRLVQTPQIFQLNILKKAYSVAENESFTDDASVVELAGFPINLFEGDYKNIKITTQEDLALAEIFLTHSNQIDFEK
ncbi:MAG: 2-C-methyl-D-erythritol 4-phosphate cytidylyltransferase [Bacteroidota bacterium]